MAAEGIESAAPGAVDAAAFAKLYDEYLPRVYGFIACRVDDREVAEQMTARVFERGLEESRRGNLGDVPVSAFLFRVAGSAVVDHARRQQREIPSGWRASDLDEPGDAERAQSFAEEAAVQRFAAAIDRAVLRRGMVDLPDLERRVVVLKYFDGLEADDLCAVLGCSRQTLAVLLHRALRAILGVADREAIDAA